MQLCREIPVFIPPLILCGYMKYAQDCQRYLKKRDHLLKQHFQTIIVYIYIKIDKIVPKTKCLLCLKAIPRVLTIL